MWTQQSIGQWLSLLLAPAQLHELLSRHRVQGNLAQNAEQPFAGLSRFWQQQIPKAPDAYIETTLRWLEEDDRHFLLTRACADYPEALTHIHRPPWLLFGKGDKSLLDKPQLAVVGSRRASHYGLQHATQLTADLTRCGWAICSGMALGIDSAAHHAALEQGADTIAVLGCGPDICYPPRARELYREIGDKGVLISEFIPGTSARSDHFLRRNRIITGLSQGVLVVEASIRSGSLVTARLALEQNRNVYALPGPVTQSSYRGNHQLIQEGAILVTCAQDILAELPALQGAMELPENIENRSKVVSTGLANQQMLANVGFETTSIDSLVERTCLPVASVMNQLISLELDGWVTAVPGGYVRVRRE
ncbi:DNA-protecting protein DprA [Aliidiomarina minuta]|uniref:DNA-protecting protein DprA n=1 Tax=Aliidiomarina minuta TaxID=880057 RepID=A0A432WA90_9GAMM|nr:DNA-processing protein DprA [Aliidiomarina minuta]RUO26961.1 DNA-protecting protein DprA [Aliidiomarina minuta]